MRPNDIKAASKIIGQNYSKQFEKSSVKELEAMFKNHAVKPKYIVAEEKSKIIGLAGFIQSWLDYDIYEIFWVNVSPSFQGKGIGTALIKKIIQIIKIKKPKTILLTTSKPELYAKKFNFKTLAKFKTDKHDLMFLRLKN